MHQYMSLKVPNLSKECSS